MDVVESEDAGLIQSVPSRRRTLRVPIAVLKISAVVLSLLLVLRLVWPACLCGPALDHAQVRVDELAHAWRADVSGPCTRPSDVDDHRDIHGRDVRYLCDARSGQRFVISAGEDGRFGTADDVSSR